jgi:hypothetical protein
MKKIPPGSGRETIDCGERNAGNLKAEARDAERQISGGPCGALVFALGNTLYYHTRTFKHLE